MRSGTPSIKLDADSPTDLKGSKIRLSESYSNTIPVGFAYHRVQAGRCVRPVPTSRFALIKDTRCTNTYGRLQARSSKIESSGWFRRGMLTCCNYNQHDHEDMAVMTAVE